MIKSAEPRKPIYLDGAQGTSEWRHRRASIPTVSKFSEIMSPVKLQKSSSQVKYAAKLASGRCGHPYEMDFRSSAMDRGNEMEPQIIANYEFMFDVDVHNVMFVYGDQTQSWGGSPDGLVGDVGGVECKYPEPWTHIEYMHRGVVPNEYLGQVYGYLFVTGREWWDFVSWHEGFDLFVKRVERTDEKYQKWAEKFEKYLADFLLLVESMVPDSPSLTQLQLEASLENAGAA